MGVDMHEYISLPADAANPSHQHDSENRITSSELEKVIVPICGHIQDLQKDVGQQVSDCLPTFTALLEVYLTPSSLMVELVNVKFQTTA